MRIAFTVDAFPLLSESFILNQVTGLLDLRHDVVIFSGTHSRESLAHPDVANYDLASRVHCHNDKPRNRFRRAITTLGLLLRSSRKELPILLRSLNALKYGKDAWSLSLFYKAALFLRHGPFDIIYCHFGENGTLGALLSEIGVPGKIITMFHGFDIRRGIETGGSMYRKLFEYGDCFLSICEYNREHLVEFGAAPEKILSHPVGIDIDRFPYRESATLIENGQPVRILTVARLVKEKGLHHGIAAIGKLLASPAIGPVEYLIVGEGPLASQLETVIQELGLANAVKLLGAREQESVVQLLHESHLFLLPSMAEALPVSLMEAQGVGLPVVATSVGSVNEVVLDGKSGFLVAPDDVDAITQRLTHLLQHPHLWTKMGRAGREHVCQHYNIRRLNEQFVAICEDLLAGKLPAEMEPASSKKE